MATATQLLAGGAVLLVLGALRGERITEVPSASAWLALGYLIVFGSMVGYTAYVYLLRTVRPALATSYAYANPVVAVALGVTLGAEVLTGPVFIALPLILAGIGLAALAPWRVRREREPLSPVGERGRDPSMDTPPTTGPEAEEYGADAA